MCTFLSYYIVSSPPPKRNMNWWSGSDPCDIGPLLLRLCLLHVCCQQRNMLEELHFETKVVPLWLAVEVVVALLRYLHMGAPGAVHTRRQQLLWLPVKEKWNRKQTVFDSLSLTWNSPPEPPAPNFDLQEPWAFVHLLTEPMSRELSGWLSVFKIEIEKYSNDLFIYIFFCFSTTPYDEPAEEFLIGYERFF